MFPTCKNVMEMTSEDIQHLLEDIDTVLFDCEGTLWHLNKPLPGAVEVVNRLIDMGKQVFLISDNSTKTQKDLADSIRKMKFNVRNEQIINTAFLTASFLKHAHFFKNVYVIGGNGITEELRNADIVSFGMGPDDTSVDVEGNLGNIEIFPNVGAVVVGHDIHLSYVKLLKAATYLRSPRCLFLGTNASDVLTSDDRCPVTLPGPGSLLKAIEAVSGREPFVIGKPCYYLDGYLHKEHNINSQKTLIIGDSADDDIEFGNMCGYITFLVLSGETSMDQLVKSKSNLLKTPQFYSKSLDALAKYFEKEGN